MNELEEIAFAVGISKERIEITSIFIDSRMLPFRFITVDGERVKGGEVYPEIHMEDGQVFGKKNDIGALTDRVLEHIGELK